MEQNKITGRTLRRAIVKEEYVAITSTLVAALLLNQLCWLSSSFVASDQALGGDDDSQTKLAPWIPLSAAEAAKQIMTNDSARTVARRLQDLEKAGFVKSRLNPTNPMDTRKQFQLQFPNVERALLRAGYYPSDWYPALTPQEAASVLSEASPPPTEQVKHTEDPGHGDQTPGHGDQTLGHGDQTPGHGDQTLGHGDQTLGHGVNPTIYKDIGYLGSKGKDAPPSLSFDDILNGANGRRDYVAKRARRESGGADGFAAQLNAEFGPDVLPRAREMTDAIADGLKLTVLINQGEEQSVLRTIQEAVLTILKMDPDADAEKIRKSFDDWSTAHPTWGAPYSASQFVKHYARGEKNDSSREATQNLGNDAGWGSEPNRIVPELPPGIDW